MSKIVLEDFNEGDGFYKVNLAYLSKEQVEEIEALVSKWNPSDEVIKSCIEMCLTDVNEQRFNDYGTNLKECLAWLEKRGEESDKVEPKFHEGEWVILAASTTLQIVKVDMNKRLYWFNDNSYLPIVDEECLYHWTIQDAKDGDVLVASDDSIFIYAGSTNTYAQFYIALSKYGDFNTKGGNWEDKNCVKPATKEQRDALMKAMTDAGWEFDFEKKKLNKIPNALEEYEIEHIEHGKYYYCIKDYYSGGNKRVSKGEVIQALRGMSMMALGVKANEYFIPVKCIVGDRCAWSEEDEHRVKDTIYFLDTAKKHYASTVELDACIDWLNSIKDRVLPQSIAYYNPYKEVVESIAEMCKHYDKASHSGLRDFYDNIKVKCKDAKEYDSLYPQDTWKPSNEQLYILNWVATNVLTDGIVDKKASEILYTLYDDLKKLKGE